MPLPGHLVRVDSAAEQLRQLLHDPQKLLLFIPLRAIHRLSNPIEKFIQLIEGERRALRRSAPGCQSLRQVSRQVGVLEDGAPLSLREVQRLPFYRPGETRGRDRSSTPCANSLTLRRRLLFPGHIPVLSPVGGSAPGAGLARIGTRRHRTPTRFMTVAPGAGSERSISDNVTARPRTRKCGQQAGAAWPQPGELLKLVLSEGNITCKKSLPPQLRKAEET